MRILVVEDDTLLADALTRCLTQAAYAVDLVRDGASANETLTTHAYDLVVLDVGLPKIDGFEVLRRLRGRRSTVPVLLLTARDALEDRVHGLDLGADDYLTKPFDLPEFEARVRALLRRGHFATSTDLTHGKLRFDIEGRRMFFGEQSVDLTARELALAELLLRRTGRVVSKEQMVDHLYGWGDEVGSNAIEVYVHRLRKKLEFADFNVRTVRGMGYLLDKAAVEDAQDK
ncbi:MAG TPA: response regulator transcription factor [Rhodocyclaceae bacterium]|jgi:two-component system OmpR family response regulator|nr:response regulator transcription factor [Rhodocyclaceae bacterium]